MTTTTSRERSGLELGHPDEIRALSAYTVSGGIARAGSYEHRSDVDVRQ